MCDIVVVVITYIDGKDMTFRRFAFADPQIGFENAKKERNVHAYAMRVIDALGSDLKFGFWVWVSRAFSSLLGIACGGYRVSAFLGSGLLCWLRVQGVKVCFIRVDEC